MNDRDERLAERLATPLPSERAAAERNWRAVSAAIATPVRRRIGVVRAAAVMGALLIAMIAGVAWWQGARLDVASGGLPVLYREEVARITIGAPGVDATVAIVQKHVEGDARLRVVAVTDIRLGDDRVPARIELRFQAQGDDSYGLLARAEVSDPRRGTRSTRTLFEAPFPPLGPRESATYRVWLHIETATGTVESPVLVIQVTDRPEGQRASEGGASSAPGLLPVPLMGGAS